MEDDAFPVDKHHIQREGDIFHPHGHDGVFFKVEEHTMVLSNVLSVGQTAQALVERFRNFNREYGRRTGLSDNFQDAGSEIRSRGRGTEANKKNHGRRNYALPKQAGGSRIIHTRIFVMWITSPGRPTGYLHRLGMCLHRVP